MIRIYYLFFKFFIKYMHDYAFRNSPNRIKKYHQCCKFNQSINLWGFVTIILILKIKPKFYFTFKSPWTSIFCLIYVSSCRYYILSRKIIFKLIFFLSVWIYNILRYFIHFMNHCSFFKKSFQYHHIFKLIFFA